MARPPGEVQAGVRPEIDALATRYELHEGAADALERFVGLVDWGETNFVPKSNQKRRARRKRRPRPQRTRVASILLTESLAGLELEPVRVARRVADIGTGAGFPGIVLAIALPQAHVTLIDKVPAKCSFLSRTTAELGLDNVDVVEGFVQQWSEGAGTCDVVTSRKVGRPEMMVERAAPLLAPGGAVALWPGPDEFGAGAAEAAAEAAKVAGLRLTQVRPVLTETHRGKRVVKHLHLYQDVRRFGRRQ
jgi:16S rRNA (guanine(527)-N(7))-methyltransferase RsmG